MNAQGAEPQPAKPSHHPGVTSGEQRHNRFLARVSSLNSGLCNTDISYLEGKVVLRATPGSIRLDVVAGHPAAPVRAYLLKTGHKEIASHRLEAIRRHLPGRASVPIVRLQP